MAQAFGLSLPDSADGIAALTPWLALPQWLSAALADLVALLHNIVASSGDSPVYRDEVLDSWGLATLAIERRRALEAVRKTEQVSPDLISLFNRFKKESENEEAHNE